MKIFMRKPNRTKFALLGFLAAGPVARVRLPQRVPFGFHGDWLPDPA